MKRNRFSEEKVVQILRDGRGMKVKEVCAKYNISEPMYYAWKKKYGEMEVSEVRKMRVMNEDFAGSFGNSASVDACLESNYIGSILRTRSTK
jgi:putative transposase